MESKASDSETDEDTVMETKPEGRDGLLESRTGCKKQQQCNKLSKDSVPSYILRFLEESYVSMVTLSIRP